MAEYTGNDPRATRPGARRVLQDERRRALAQRQAAAVAIEGTAATRIERLQRIESGVGDPAERVGTDRERQVRASGSDRGRRLCDGKGARRACGRERGARAVHREGLCDRGGGGREWRAEEARHAPPGILAGLAAAVFPPPLPPPPP